MQKKLWCSRFRTRLKLRLVKRSKRNNRTKRKCCRVSKNFPPKRSCPEKNVPAAWDKSISNGSDLPNFRCLPNQVCQCCRRIAERVSRMPVSKCLDVEPKSQTGVSSIPVVKFCADFLCDIFSPFPLIHRSTDVYDFRHIFFWIWEHIVKLQLSALIQTFRFPHSIEFSLFVCGLCFAPKHCCLLFWSQGV